MWKKDKAEVSTQDVDPGVNQLPGTISDPGHDVIAFIRKGVTFKGTITYDGTVRIDGTMDGEIQTDGVLLVGEEAVIMAKVSAGTIISKGKMTGDFVARTKISLLCPAVLTGSVKTPLLSMEEGASSSMEPVRWRKWRSMRFPVRSSRGWRLLQSVGPSGCLVKKA